MTGVGHAGVAIIVLAVHAEVDELLPLGHDPAGDTLDCVDILPSNHHILLLVLTSGSELFQAFQLAAGAQLLLHPFIPHHLLREVLNKIHMPRP
jgi:hypothetical protein